MGGPTRQPIGYSLAMYQDSQPCQVCGSEVRLQEPTRLGVVDADPTVDERVCTNPDCPTNGSGADTPDP